MAEVIPAPKEELPNTRHGICQNCSKRGHLRRVDLEIPDTDPVETKAYWVCEIKRDGRGRPKGCNSDSIKEWDRNATIERQKRDTNT